MHRGEAVVWSTWLALLRLCHWPSRRTGGSGSSGPVRVSPGCHLWGWEWWLGRPHLQRAWAASWAPCPASPVAGVAPGRCQPQAVTARSPGSGPFPRAGQRKPGRFLTDTGPQLQPLLAHSRSLLSDPPLSLLSSLRHTTPQPRPLNWPSLLPPTIHPPHAARGLSKALM